MEELPIQITKAARELKELIRDSKITMNYESSLKALNKDKKSREILEKLVMYGKLLNEKQQKGEDIRLDPSQEVEMTRKELENNSLLKNYLIHQKEYLNMIKEVMDRIKNPVENIK